MRHARHHRGRHRRLRERVGRERLRNGNYHRHEFRRLPRALDDLDDRRRRHRPHDGARRRPVNGSGATVGDSRSGTTGRQCVDTRSASSTIAVAAADHAASTPAGAQVASPAGATAGTSGNVSDSTLAAVSGAARRVWKRAIRTIETIASSTARIAPEPAAGVRAVATDLPVHGRLEVSNAVGIKRLAAHTARQLGRYGVEVSRLSDYRPFGLPVTQIQYRDGHLTDARALQQHLPVTATMVPVASLREGVDLRLVVGRDMIAGRSAVPGVVVWWEQRSVPAPAPVRVAAGEAGGWRLL